MTRRSATPRARRRVARAAPSDPATTRILDAALAELVARGFAAASTNTIAASAGVAKGLVFHHFGSKEDLFVAVFDYVIARTIDALYADVGPLPVDLFERLHAWALHKLRVFQRDPLGYQFTLLAVNDAPAAVRPRIQEKLVALGTEHWPRILDGVDASRLRDGITLPQAIETLALLAEGIERSILPQLAALPDRGISQLDAISGRIWTHFERLRDGLYGPAAVDGA